MPASIHATYHFSAKEDERERVRGVTLRRRDHPDLPRLDLDQGVGGLRGEHPHREGRLRRSGAAISSEPYTGEKVEGGKGAAKEGAFCERTIWLVGSREDNIGKGLAGRSGVGPIGQWIRFLQAADPVVLLDLHWGLN
nr:unnamed protein product [Digitaria exilis]